MKAVVIVKCVSCGHRGEIKAREIPKDEVPICPKCFSLMIAEKAKTKD